MGLHNIEHFTDQEIKLIFAHVNPAIASYAEYKGRDDMLASLNTFKSAKTVADAVRTLKAQGLIFTTSPQAMASANLVASGAGLGKCINMATGAINTGSSGEVIEGPCTLQALHDGPCQIGDSLVSGALAKAMGKSAKSMLKDSPVLSASFSSLASSVAKTLVGSQQPGGLQGSNGSQKADGQGDGNEDPFVKHSELLEAFNGFSDVLEKDLDIRDTAIKTALGSSLDDIERDFQERINAIQVSGGGQILQYTDVYLPEFSKPTQLSKRTHGAFPKIMRLINAGLNVFMVGPGGSGKTTIAEDVAASYKRPYVHFPCTAGVSEGQITGQVYTLEGGRQFWVPSDVIMAFGGEQAIFEDGKFRVVKNDDMAGVILFDELAAMDANTSIVLNAPFANGIFSVGRRILSGLNPIVPKHAKNIILAADNTYGSGMSVEYQGRNALDGAFLDRFYIVKVGYDPLIECQIANLPAPTNHKVWEAAPPPSEKELQELGKWYFACQKFVGETGIKKIWGTRMLTKARSAREAGIPSMEVKHDLLLGWPPDIAAKMLTL